MDLYPDHTPDPTKPSGQGRDAVPPGLHMLPILLVIGSQGDTEQPSGQGRDAVPPGLHMLPILLDTGSQGDTGQPSGQGRQDTEGGSCPLNQRQVHKRSYPQRGSLYPQGTKKNRIGSVTFFSNNIYQ